jgi:hypothetical protein
LANVCKAIEDLKKEAFEEGRRIGLAEIREEESPDGGFVCLCRER